MSHLAIRRVSAFATLVFIVIFLFFSPFAELYGEHRHGCPATECNVCFIANTLAILREIFLGALTCSVAILLFLEIRRTFQFREPETTPFSLVAFKTDILS